MQMQKTTLPNGLPVMAIDTDSYPSFTAIVLVGAGSRYETTQNNGIAHFFEHMVFKGTKQYPDAFTIASLIEGMGGVCNAFTDKDHTGYWIKAPSKHLETVLSILSQMVREPLLPEDEIEREKGVIIEEMNMYEDMPARKVGDIFEEQLYEGTSLGFDIIGTKESVQAATRETFTSYMQQRYRPSNAVLVLSGSLTDARSHQELIDLVTDQFGSWEDQPVPGIEPITESQDAIRSYADVRKTEQAHFCLGFRTFGYDDQRRYPLSVLAAMLGGGMASRLFTEVRERRGLCYYISTGREFYHDVGNIVTQAGVSTSVEKIQEAVDVTLDQHRQFVQGQFSDEELTRAKEMIKGRIVLSLEDSRSMASFMGTRWLLQGDAQTPEQVMEAISAVTKDQVQEVARFCFQPERLQFAMIGPVAADQIKIAYNT